MVNGILRRIGDKAMWPILISSSDTLTEENKNIIVQPHSYIIFLWPQRGNSIYDIIQSQMEMQQDAFTWNPRGSFLIVVTDPESGESHTSVARHICEIMWETGKIANVIVLITNSSEYVTQSYTSHMAVEESKTMDIYTAFPYKRGNCGRVTEANLIDKWILENNGRFSRNADLYPTKTPHDFMGCPIKIESLGKQSFVFHTDNHTQEDGSIGYDVRGLCVEFFRIPLAKMNFKIVFQHPLTEISFETFMTAVRK
jgi:hypothetical protein